MSGVITYRHQLIDAKSANQAVDWVHYSQYEAADVIIQGQ